MKTLVLCILLTAWSAAASITSQIKQTAEIVTRSGGVEERDIFDFLGGLSGGKNKKKPTKSTPAKKKTPTKAKTPAKAKPSAAAKSTSIKTVVFDCSGAGEACNTMCFGIHCKRKPSTLTWDNPSQAKKNIRRTSAGCQAGSNRCGQGAYKGKGYQCDEYPFATTKEADSGGQVNRCVLTKDQRSQGGTLKVLYHTTCGGPTKAPCKFRVTFRNAGSHTYCKASRSCKGDGNIFTRSGPVRRDLLLPGSEMDDTVELVGRGEGDYRLRSGDVIYSPASLELGETVFQAVPINETLHRELAARDTPLLESDLFESDMADNMRVVEDEVVEKL